MGQLRSSLMIFSRHRKQEHLPGLHLRKWKMILKKKEMMKMRANQGLKRKRRVKGAHQRAANFYLKEIKSKWAGRISKDSTTQKRKSRRQLSYLLWILSYLRGLEIHPQGFCSTGLPELVKRWLPRLLQANAIPTSTQWVRAHCFQNGWERVRRISKICLNQPDTTAQLSSSLTK